MLILSKTLLDKIHESAIEAYPEECCGALLGQINGDEKQVQECMPILNTSNENKKRRFMITDQDYMAAEKRARKQGYVLLGFYHSHPDHPPIPSETDKQFAWPHFSYPILAIDRKVPQVMKSYVYSEEKEPTEEPIKVLS